MEKKVVVQNVRQLLLLGRLQFVVYHHSEARDISQRSYTEGASEAGLNLQRPIKGALDA